MTDVEKKEAAAKAAVEKKEAAAKAAVEKKEAAAKVKYISVTKDGETIRVHPTQVEQHQHLGWSLVEKEE